MSDHERLCELLERADTTIDRDFPDAKNVRNEIASTLTRLRSSGPDGLRVVPVEPT